MRQILVPALASFVLCPVHALVSNAHSSRSEPSATSFNSEDVATLLEDASRALENIGRASLVLPPSFVAEDYAPQQPFPRPKAKPAQKDRQKKASMLKSVMALRAVTTSYVDESVVPSHKYEMLPRAASHTGNLLTLYEDRHYSVKECRVLCDQHPACRSFTFGWGSSRSCSLHDQCMSSDEPLVGGEAPRASYRTFFRNCTETVASPLSANPVEEPLFLFVGVATAPGYFLRREYIRKAWMRNLDVGPGRPIEARFFVGQSQPGQAAALQREMDEHGDIVQLAVPDSYDDLTAKTLELIRWAVFYKEAKFVMKLDDDTYPNFHNLLPILHASTPKYSLHGHIFTCAPVLNFTKWAEKKEVYNQPFYPTYAQGSGYILSYALAKDIGVTRYEDHKGTMLHNEDASVGLWIKRDKLLDIDLKNTAYSDLSSRTTLYGCRENDVLSMNLQKRQMPCMWEKEARGSRSVCCPEAYRADYNKASEDSVLYEDAAKFVSADVQKVAARLGPSGIPLNALQLDVQARLGRSASTSIQNFACFNA